MFDALLAVAQQPETLAMLAVIFFAVVIGAPLYAMVVEPLTDVASTARRIADGDLSQRLPLRTGGGERGSVRNLKETSPQVAKTPKGLVPVLISQGGRTRPRASSQQQMRFAAGTVANLKNWWLDFKNPEPVPAVRSVR